MDTVGPVHFPLSTVHHSTLPLPPPSHSLTLPRLSLIPLWSDLPMATSPLPPPPPVPALPPSSSGDGFSPTLAALLSSCTLSSIPQCADSAQRLLWSVSVDVQRRHPVLAAAGLTSVAVLLLLVLLPDVRQEVTRRLWGKKQKANVERSTSPLPSASAAPTISASTFASPAGPSSPVAPSQAGEADFTGRSGGGEAESRGSPIPFSPSGGFRGDRGDRGGSGESGHSRHRSSQAAYEGGERDGPGGSRERDRDRVAHERFDRERDREREAGRRRSRWDEEDDGGGGWTPQPHYRGERSERSDKGPERRRRERDGREGYGSHANGAEDSGGRYRPSLSPTPSQGLSLPSAGHRHHQSFSSPVAPPSPSESMAARETSVSSLPSASMLQSAQSYSALSTEAASPSSGRVDESFLYTLARGCELVKYGKYGSPHVRWFQVQLVNGLARLSWGEPKSRTGGSLNLSKSIKMNDILDVKAGKTTAVFRQRGNDKLATDSRLCFSIISQRRSLDLQAKDPEERDRWVDGLRQIAHDSHWGQQPPPLSSSASASSASLSSLAQPHFPSLHRSGPSSSPSASSSGPSPFSSSHPPSDFPVAQQKLVVTALAQQQRGPQSSAAPFPPLSQPPAVQPLSVSPSPTPSPLHPQPPSPFASASNSPLHRPFFTYHH